MNESYVGIHPFGHDSALVSIKEDKNRLFIYAESTERITRQKHDVRPIFAIKFFKNILKKSSYITIANNESKKIQIPIFNIQSFRWSLFLQV